MDTSSVIIVFTIAFLIGFALTIYALANDDNEIFIPAVLGVFLMAISLFVIASSLEEPKPEPIDVYRGKTTLKVTYQDSVAVDSVVVWKNKYKPD